MQVAAGAAGCSLQKLFVVCNVASSLASPLSPLLPSRSSPLLPPPPRFPTPQNFRDELFGPPHPHPAAPAPPPAVSLPPTPSASMASSASIMSVDAPPGGSANGNANGNGVADVALSPMEKAVAIVKAFQPAYWQVG